MNYTVKKGDGWYKIAKNMGVDVNELLQANNANLNTMIHPGLILNYPKGSEKRPSMYSTDVYSMYPQAYKLLNASEIPQDFTGVSSTYAKKYPYATQKALNDAGYKIKIDGIWGPKSQKALDLALKDGAVVNYNGVLTFPKKQLVSKSVNLNSNNPTKTNVKDLLQQLKKAGYDLGKSGVDGIWGNKSNAALNLALKDGYVLENGRLIKSNLKSKNPSATSLLYSVNPMFGTPINNPAKKEQSQNDGYAFYISYPEHSISTKGTGYEWLGSTVPGIKGHAAAIIVDGQGNATYHSYGRYNSMGSYITKKLPAVKPEEDKQAYLKRIRPYLEYADKNEPVNAAYIPNVNAVKSRAYYSNEPNKDKYSITLGITCAGEACKGIDAGTGIDSASAFDWFIPDTSENVRLINYKGNELYSF